MKRIVFVLSVLAALMLAPRPYAQQPRSSVPGTGTTVATALLAPTNHARLPRDESRLWLAPQGSGGARGAAVSDVAAAIKLQASATFSKALPVLSQASAQRGPLGDYAMYYAGLTQYNLGNAAEARRTFEALRARRLVGYLVQAAAFGEADADEALNNPSAAVDLYERLLKDKIGPPDEVLMRLGKVAKEAGETTKAGEAFARVHYEFALSEFAPAAGSELLHLPYLQPMTPGSQRYKLELGRAERFFGAKQYSLSRAAFEGLRPSALGDDREVVDLRLAECDYFLKRPRNARDGVRPYISHASRSGEALFFYAIASNEIGDKAEYLKSVRRLADEFPTEMWAEEGLNHLATQYIIQDDDDAADATFREMYEKYPKGAYAERAAWKIGWRAFRGKEYSETVRVFDRAAADFVRSDYRPSWLYWSGRAHELMNEPAVAEERYLLTATDYLNSYYGRLASRRLHGRAPVQGVIAADVDASGDDVPRLAPLPPNGEIIRTLLESGLYHDALNELRFADRTWGASPAVQATVAWIHQKQGQFETGARRFTLVRGAITNMRRAYPQFMAAGGEELPRDILTVIFPLSYWDLIQKYSTLHELDPYLVAALVAQESTFVPDIKSYANAVGLMQLLPSTGRRYAAKLSVRYAASTLTSPESNVKLGTAYFADLVKEFGNVHMALAGYNAGETAVRRWVGERPDLPADEFVDDIPYPQTQNYVKRILGTAEDYRRLYSSSSRVDELAPAAKLASVAQGVGAPPAKTKSGAAKKPATKKPAAKKKAPKSTNLQ